MQTLAEMKKLLEIADAIYYKEGKFELPLFLKDDRLIRYSDFGVLGFKPLTDVQEVIYDAEADEATVIFK